MASVNRVHCYTKGYTQLGIETRVIIPEATIPYKDRDLTQNKLAEGYFNGTYFKYMSGTTIRNKRKWKRPFLDLISRIKTIYYISKESDKETVLLVWGGGIIWCPIMQFCGHLKGIKVYTELNELPYGTEIENKKRAILRKIMLKYIFPHFDGFIAISETLKKLAEKYNKKENAVLKVPILVDPTVNNENIKLIKKNHPFIFHSGTLFEQKDGIVKMLTAFALAKKEIKDLKFYLTGNLEKTYDAKVISDTITKYQLHDSVHFLGYLNNNDLYRYQKSCSLMIIYKYDTLQNQYCFSTKLGEYLAFAKPVILTNIGEAMFYMKNGENSLIADWQDIKKIADHIITIVKNPQLAKQLGKAGQRTCQENFNYSKHAKRMIEYFTKKMN